MKSTFFEDRDNKEILGKSLAQEMAHGLVLADFFEISEKAREGGMGDVFFCRDKRDNKFYVLKTYKKANSSFEDFSKEAELILKLKKHPHVVYAKTIITDADNYYIVMEYVGKQPYTIDDPVQGETLARVMDKVKIEPKQALIWAVQFCQGMQFLHQAGVETHKDIKPDNILITPENNIKIADFGLAGLDKKGGTIGYRAPEYFKEGEKLTIQSDIYSFGLVLYQMLNGGKSLPNATIWDEKTKEYEKIDINSIQSEHCLEIIKKCLVEKPEERYKKFKEIEKELRKYLKATFPEYQFEDQKIEEMTANDWFLKGLGHNTIGRKGRSFWEFSQAISLNPSLSLAYYWRYELIHSYLPYINGIKLGILVLFILYLFIYMDIIFIFGYYIAFLYTFFLLAISSYWFWSLKKNFSSFKCNTFIIILFFMVFLKSFLIEAIESIFWVKKAQEIGICSTLFFYIKHEDPSFAVYAISCPIVLLLIIFLIYKGFWRLRDQLPELDIRYKDILFWAKALLCNKDKEKAFQLNFNLKKYNLLQNYEKYSYFDVINAYQSLIWENYISKESYLYHRIEIAYFFDKYEEVVELSDTFEIETKNNNYNISILFLKYKSLRRKNEKNLLCEMIFQEGKRLDFSTLGTGRNFVSGVLLLPNRFLLSKSEIYRNNLLYIMWAFYEKKSLEGCFCETQKIAVFFQLKRYKDVISIYEKTLLNESFDISIKQEKIQEDLRSLDILFQEKERALFSSNIKFEINNIYLEVGICYYRLQQFSKAFDVFNKGITLKPNKDLYDWRRKSANSLGKMFYKGCLQDRLGIGK